MSREAKEKMVQQMQDWEKPHLRLFFSADIVGSTAFKQSRTPDNPTEAQSGQFPHWFNAVLAFYHHAEQAFSKHWLQVSSTNHEPDSQHLFGPNPELWKTIGDEVLFTKKIEHPAQAIMCCHAWIRALEDLRVQLKRQRLDVKSSAWIADFPLTNQEVILLGAVNKEAYTKADDEFPFHNQLALESFYTPNSQSSSPNVIRDYIGPSIDTGFRIGSLASTRKMVLSIELAYILSSEQSKIEDDPLLYSSGAMSPRKFDFRYDGRTQLKGVMNGSPYPIIWIDLNPGDPLHQAEDEVLRTPKPSASQIRSLAESFIQANSTSIFRPYFFQTNGGAGEEISESHLDELIARHERFATTKEKRAREAEVDGVDEDLTINDLTVDLPSLKHEQALGA